MKRNAGCVLTAILFTGLLLTGCKKAAGPAQSAGGQLTWPRLTNDDVTFSIFLGDLGNLVSSYEYKDNLFTQKITDETGIKIEPISSSPADAVQRLNILLSTGDYPDLIFRPSGGGGYALTAAELAFYAKEGIFIPLDEYDPLSFTNIRNIFNEYPAAYDLCRGPDGKLYALPEVGEYVHTRLGNNTQLYHQPFMLKYERETGRGIPKTLDEFTTYLRWIRDTDANENGNRNDEIPLAFASNSIRVFIEYFAKCYMPFVVANNYFGLAREGNRVIEQYKDPRFREALQYMSMIYAERLVYPDSFTQPQQELVSITSAEPATLAVGTGSGVNNGGTTYYYHARWLPVLIGPRGDQWAFDQGPWQPLRAKVNITDKCKDPKLAIALVDYLLDFDVFTTGYLGAKGYAWDDPDPGALSLIGEPARFKVLRPNGTQDLNSTWSQIFPTYRSATNIYCEQANDVENIQKWLLTGDPSLLPSMRTNGSYNEVKNVIQGMARRPYMTRTEQVIPPLPGMSDADSRRIGDIDVVLQSALDQGMVAFITGGRNINNDALWTTFLGDLDRVGSGEKASIIEKYLK